jgi:hypothetical protein
LHKRGKVLIVLLFIDLFFLAAALAVNGLANVFLGWLFLNVIGVLIWLAVRKRFSTKKKYGHRRNIQYQLKKDHEESYQFESRQYGIETITQRGDTVRSKGEGRVADYFYRNKIRYRYEPPVFEKRGRQRLIGCPDFYLYDYDVYVEYWGMSSVPNAEDSKRYNTKRHWKMEKYAENGYKVISIERRHLDMLESMFPAALKEATGQKGNM